MIKNIVTFTLLVAICMSSITLKDLEGQYDIGSQCDSWSCPRTSYLDSKNNFCCPLSGNSGQIQYDSDNSQYKIYFDTYNEWWDNKSFYIYFTDYNVQKNDQGELITIPMEGPYEFNLQPCWNGSKTHELCQDNPQYPQVVVFKSDPVGKKQPTKCTFIMDKVL